MKCLSPISVSNPKYKKVRFVPTRITCDGELVEKIDDSKLLVPCGTCYACLKNKRNSIAFRLYHEYLGSKSAYFITLTVSDENMYLFEKDAKGVFRKWFEHLRYKTGHSPRHWIVSELGSKTHRLHFHGILFDPPFDINDLSRLWTYGFSYVGYCNQKTISYIVKYITKPQLLKEGYKPFILQSNRPGLGSSYLTPSRVRSFRNTKDHTVYFGKARISLPRYYFNKIYDDVERRQMAVEYQKQLLSNPFEYLYNVLLRSKQFDLSAYINHVQQHYINTLELGQSIKPKFLTQKTILQDGSFTANYDDSTSEGI